MMAKSRTEKGYVIVNQSGLILSNWFGFYRGAVIKQFVKDCGENWSYWRKVYKFKCVKATQTTQLS